MGNQAFDPIDMHCAHYKAPRQDRCKNRPFLPAFVDREGCREYRVCEWSESRGMVGCEFSEKMSFFTFRMSLRQNRQPCVRGYTSTSSLPASRRRRISCGAKSFCEMRAGRAHSRDRTRAYPISDAVKPNCATSVAEMISRPRRAAHSCRVGWRPRRQAIRLQLCLPRAMT
jgi:hypothetical protein